MNGRTGLDYSVIPIVLRMRRVPRSDWDELLSMIQVMEDAVLAMQKT